MRRLFTALACIFFSSALIESCAIAPSFQGSISNKSTNEFFSNSNIKVDILEPEFNITDNPSYSHQCKIDVYKILQNRLGNNTKESLITASLETEIIQSKPINWLPILSGLSVVTLNVLGLPFYSNITSIKIKIKITDQADDILFEDVIMKSKDYPIGLYYNYNNLKNNRGICIELINECVDTFIKEYKNLDSIIQINNKAKDELPEMETYTSSLSNRIENISFNQVPKNIEVKTIAVIPLEGQDCKGNKVSGDDLASYAEGSLLGLYNIVERRYLETVLDEQQLALSGILFEESAVEAGCNIGAQGIIFIEYGCLTNQETIQLKLVDCQTSELYWSATGTNVSGQQILTEIRKELLN
tara:strand:+ start:958 stop:2031 length:1074 start_codon:yes stop_codon:yes gene_type:complete